MIKKLFIFSVCCVAAGIIFLIVFCRLKPDGGAYWTFITYAPVISAGDGSSYETAYLLKKGQDRWLATVECGLMHDKYGVEDDVLSFTNTNLNGRVFDVISYPLSIGRTNSVYFDVTEYRKTK
jgi:hypothetical protein